MSETRRLSWIAILLGLLVTSSANAQSACPPFPDVPWRYNLNHQTASEYVSKKCGGNWAPYISRWEFQVRRIREIEARGSAALVTTDKIRLQGQALRKYGDLVDKRLAVMRCLAGQASRPPILTTAATKNAIPAPVPTVPAEGQKIAAAKGCLACHGANGIATRPAIPNLAGQNEFYLVKEIKDFQSAPPASGADVGATERHDRIMREKGRELSDDDVWNLASYFASLPPACLAKSPAPAAIRAPNKAATCIECHGLQGQPIFPDVPVIAGQNQAYLETQLRQFRTSAGGISQGPNWASRYHYFMSAIAKSLSNRQVLEQSRRS